MPAPYAIPAKRRQTGVRDLEVTEGVMSSVATRLNYMSMKSKNIVTFS
jgi:hypothetical protein